jgi:nicotinamidase-related amidase
MKRALVAIDVQESFRQRANWAAISNPEIAKQVGLLAETFRANGEMIVWVLHAEPGTNNVFDPDSGYVRLIEGLVAAQGEPVITKTSFNAFYTTNLQQLLTSAGIVEVVLCGIRTEQCVETTARDAAGRGYEVTYVTDATATNPIEHRDAPPGRPLEEILADPLTLQVDDIIDRTEYALAGRFATIRTVEELTGG